jgi:hypothetical protein
MRAVHNTPIPDDSTEFPIPDDCTCDGTPTLCDACEWVVSEDLEEQKRERDWLNAGR